MIRFAVLTLLCCAAVAAPSPETDIRAVLDRQVADWNRGDVNAFMQGYADSDQTLFIGKTVTRGWQQVIERYRKSYPSKDRMGRLEFSDVLLELTGDLQPAAAGLARDVVEQPAAETIFVTSCSAVICLKYSSL
jgi:hypothetical protein